VNKFGDAQLREYLADAQGPFWGTAHLTTRGMRRQLLGSDSEQLESRVRTAGGERDPLRHAMLVDQRLRLPSDLLMRTDRATMAWSIEARVPMLANEVLAMSWRLNHSGLCRLVPPASKPLLKRVAAQLVPPEAVYRRKVGFDLPLEQWLKHDFKCALDAMLRERRIEGLDYAAIAQWLAALHGGARRLSGVLWAWLVLETWYRRWIESVAAPRVGAEALRN
jgi:asparagine synthase (glutamine-hydrolysing)